MICGLTKNEITYKSGLTKEITCDISLVNKLVSYLIYYTSTSYNVINLYKLVDLRISRSFKDELFSSLKDNINNDLDKNDPQFINSLIIKCKIKLTITGKKNVY